MDALYRRMPVDRLRVPAADFAAVLNAAAARFAADRSDRFAAGVLACAQWIAGITEDHPIRDGREPCTVEGMESCQMMADAVVYEMPHAPSGIDRRWALGVAGMVSWARGAARRPPVSIDSHRAA
ncbi:hypothetical protein ACFW0V_30945 [Micromonospora parva]|uniref:hypothetical protein n=1 Tax=Micromonospora parva TaxID=1464048 RepID=UPI003670362C